MQPQCTEAVGCDGAAWRGILTIRVYMKITPISNQQCNFRCWVTASIETAIIAQNGDEGTMNREKESCRKNKTVFLRVHKPGRSTAR